MIEFDVDMGYLLECDELDKVVLNDEDGEHEPMEFVSKDAATVVAGTCHVKAVKKLGDLFGFSLSCGHSMVNPFDDRPDYCPWCGAKVIGG